MSDERNTVVVFDVDTYTDVEETCEKSPSGLHEPDWNTVKVENDNREVYIDINCKHCGMSGCVGTQNTLEKDICW